MKRLHAFAAAALLAALHTAAFGADTDVLQRIRERQRIVIGSEMTFPTMNVRDAGGRNVGFMADLGRAIARRMLGREDAVEWKKITDEERVAEAAQARVDMVLDTTTASAEKARQVDFSEEIFTSGSGLLVKRGSPIRSVADIGPGTRVLYVRANQDIQRIREQVPRATYVEFENSRDAFAALQAGQGEVFTQVVTHLYRAANQDHNYEVVQRFTTKPYCVLLPKGNPQLVAAVNAALRDIRASGEYDRLYAQWFGPYGGTAAR